MVYGISVLTLAYKGLFRKDGFERIKESAKKAGYDGLQLVPLNWDWSYVNPCDPAILAYEEGWGNKWLFDMNHILYFPDAYFCSHQFGEGIPTSLCVTEIHPDLTTSVDLYSRHYNFGGRYCLDTLHLRREHRKKKELKINVENLLETFRADAFPLIHIHPQIKELRQYFKGEGPTCDLLRLLKQTNKIDSKAVIIIEAFPLLPPPFDIWFARKLLQVAKSILEPKLGPMIG